MPRTDLLSIFSTAMWCLVLFSELGALARLLMLRLWRFLPFFCTYLITDISRSLLLWSLGKSPNTKMYRTVWISTEPWAIAMDLLVTLELYNSLYRAYPGIHRFARIVIGLGIVVAVTVTFGTLSIDLNHITWRVPDLQRMFLIKRAVSSVIAIVLAITMTTFPRAECAATVIQHGWLLTGLFSARALGFFVVNLGINSDWITLPFLATQFGLYLLWSFWLSAPTTPLPPRSPADVARTEKWNRELLDAANWLVR